MSKSNLRELHAYQIDLHRKEGDDFVKKWVTASLVGNGAALAGIFSWMTKEGGLPIMYLMLPSSWIFLSGILSASLSSLMLAGMHRKNEEYWGYLDANIILVESNLEPDAETKDLADRADKLGDRYGAIAGYAAIMSALLFIIGIAVPMMRLTWRAIFGSL